MFLARKVLFLGILICRCVAVVAVKPGMPTCKRFLGVPGNANQKNDIIVCGDTLNAKKHVLYFGGDVQDYQENMEAQKHFKVYSEWNLDAIAELLHKRFSSSVVFVIKPARMFESFSIFSNFVESNDYGAPTHSSNYGAIRHLESLYRNILNMSTEKETVCQSPLDGCSEDGINVPLTLIGFSKGCIVLNQIVYEVGLEQNSAPHIRTFVQNIKEFYWLDGGHSGGSKTWVIERDPLQNLSKLQCDIHVHVTPHQVRDKTRKWIGEEEEEFVRILSEYNCNVTETLHFKDDPPSLLQHFRVLNVF